MSQQVLADTAGVTMLHAETLLRCYFLAEFMSEGIVDTDYKPPVQLTTSFRFTARGNRLVNQTKGNSIEMREAQAAVFITTWAGRELLIDLENTDVGNICTVLSSEMRRKKIRMPWIYGRALYDKVSESSFWGHSHPTADESLRLLGDMPQGVFQLGPYVSGPYGLLEARQWRNVFYSHTVPGYHCEDVECDVLHGVHLASGDNGVNRGLLSIREKLSKSSQQVDESYVDAITNVAASYMPPFSWNYSSRLPFFLIDTLTLADLKLLLATLLDGTNGSLRNKCEGIGLTVGRAQEFVDNLAEAELLQLVLLAMDSEIHVSLNNLIWLDENGIRIEDGEVRKSMIAPGGTGPLSINIQSSKLGVRYKPAAAHLPLRLQQIIDAAFPADNASAQAQLSWRLRHMEGDTAIAKLNVALAEAQPVEIIERLLVSDEPSYSIALTYLGLTPSTLAHKSDREIARLIAWHIGFPVDVDKNELTGLYSALEDMRQLISNLPANFLEPSDVRKIKRVAVELFPALELVLKTALEFTVWALIRDHFANRYELSFSPARTRAHFIMWAKERNSGIANDRLENMRLDLGELLSCFGLVAKFLRKIEASAEIYRRPRDDWPRISQEPSCPFEFPFVHTFPFLDLDNGSRGALLATVERVASGLGGAEISRIRNRFFHDSDDLVEREDIGKAIGEIERRVADLVGQGLYPVRFALKGSRSDKYGRTRHSLASDAGTEVLLTRPTSIMLFGFPALSAPQIVVVGGRLACSGEPLRFTALQDSDYRTRWESNFPARPPRRTLPSALGTIAGRH